MLIKRLALLVALAGAAAVDRNPLVRLEALLGLSPAPLERVLGLKGPFSGMTEGIHRLAHGNLVGSVQANIFTPAFAILVATCCLSGWRPRIRTKRQERGFFCAMLVMAAAVTLLN